VLHLSSSSEESRCTEAKEKQKKKSPELIKVQLTGLSAGREKPAVASLFHEVMLRTAPD